MILKIIYKKRLKVFFTTNNQTQKSLISAKAFIKIFLN
ncbi:hypothetical protein HPHPH21_0467 [Helicobacter pylori Hp H-21]|nr:hypothetical protein HPHPH21_0467 [Helicobacter pylori Hp H-21]